MYFLVHKAVDREEVGPNCDQLVSNLVVGAHGVSHAPVVRQQRVENRLLAHARVQTRESLEEAIDEHSELHQRARGHVGSVGATPG